MLPFHGASASEHFFSRMTLPVRRRPLASTYVELKMIRVLTIMNSRQELSSYE